MSEVEELHPMEFSIGPLIYEWAGELTHQLITYESAIIAIGTMRWIANKAFFLNFTTPLPTGAYQYHWCLAIDTTESAASLRHEIAGLKRHMRKFT